MSVEIKIPKEINSYETKLVAGLTTRQTVCAIGLGASCLFFYTLLQPIAGQDVASFTAMVAAVPFACCGWIKPFGMNFEQYAICVLQNSIFAPAHYKYKTENYYELLLKDITKEELKEIEMEEKKNNKKTKKHKYKKSKLAIK